MHEKFDKYMSLLSSTDAVVSFDFGFKVHETSKVLHHICSASVGTMVILDTFTIYSTWYYALTQLKSITLITQMVKDRLITVMTIIKRIRK